MGIIRNRAQCTLCNDIIESLADHDVKTCSCDNLSIDGGLTHLSRSCRNKDSFIELSELSDEKTPISKEVQDAIESLVEGVEVDLNEPLPAERNEELGLEMDTDIKPEEYDIALKTVSNIFDEWQLDNAEQQGFMNGSEPPIIRLSRILNIYRLLRTNWTPSRTASWLREPNDYFDGKSALKVITESESGLEEVQRRLKYEQMDEE